MIERVSDEAVAASVAPTLRAIYAAGGSTWSRQATAQLIGLVEYVEARGADPTAERRVALQATLDDLGDNPLVPATGSAEERAASALVTSVGRHDPAAEVVRTRLRAVLVAELDDELASTMVLMDGFRARVRDA